MYTWFPHLQGNNLLMEASTSSTQCLLESLRGVEVGNRRVSTGTERRDLAWPGPDRRLREMTWQFSRNSNSMVWRYVV